MMSQVAHYRLLVFCVGTVLTLSGCEKLPSGGSGKAAAATAHKVEPISPARLSARIAMGEIQLIDVRTAKEFAQGHIAGAINVPVESFDPKLLPVAPGKETVLYCRSGRRSGLAGEMMLRGGADQARHLVGGIDAWRAAGLPTTP